MYADTAWLDALSVRSLFNVSTGAKIDLDDTGKVYPSIANGNADSNDPPWVRRRYGWITFGGKITPTAQNQIAVNAMNAKYQPPAAFNCWVDRDGTGNPAQWRLTISAAGRITMVGPNGSQGSTSGALHLAGITPYLAADV